MNVDDPVWNPRRDAPPTAFAVSAKFVAIGLACIVAGLTVASIAVQWYKHTWDAGRPSGLVRLWYLDNEGNIPTTYAFLSLLVAGLLLLLLARAHHRRRQRYARHWYVLSGIFLLLALDEAAGIHEMSIAPLRTILSASGVFHFAWVIPASVLVLLVGLAYLRFLIDLPPRIGRLFVVAATVYIGGALGMELIGGRHAELYGMENLGYALLATAEECIEMVGITVFLYALLIHIRTQLHAITVCVQP